MEPGGAARDEGPAEQVAFSDPSAYAGSLAIPTVTGEELLPGDQLAGYQIEAVIGRGGMGVVYRAYDARLGRSVALKLIAPERAQDERFRERFLVETQLAASLDHSNVVPVYDAGEAEGHLYIAMRYVEGTDLRTLLSQEAPLDPQRALALVSQVAAALDAAHGRGLVHRDVKPANILVAEETGREHCYLSDFGLTRAPDAGGSQSEPAHLSGTVAYTSPEQITGDPVTGRADVYSLACVLYECLSGDPPFARRRSMAVLVAHVQEAPPPLPAHPALDPVFSRALAKDASERYGAAGEFVEEAVAALGGKELPPELSVRTPLIGREDDLRWLREAWEEATKRHGHVAVISGQRGMGKTRLAAELAREVRGQGGEVRYVSCVGGGDLAARALAEAGTVTTPVLLVIDDLDAANDELLDAVRQAGHALTSTSALVLATSRTAFPGAPHRELQPLDTAALAELAGSIAGDAALSLPLDAVLEETGGVPLRVHEIVAEWLRADASRRLGEAALRAAAGRQELRAAQAELTSSVVDLQQALGRVEADAEVAERVCPYKGLASFDVGDADAFFGREQVAAELVARLPGATLLGVVGPSGSGKSSIVRAGLSAALASGALPGSEDWAQVVIRPGEHPLDELAGARRGRNGKLLLVVDQLEEVFTLCRDDAERMVFLDALTRPAPDETIVIAVRADFYGRFAALPALAALLAENHVLVGPMKAEDLRRAIELPSRKAGLNVEPALVDALVADVVDEPGGLPLLSTALVELWQHRDGRMLRLDTYRESGGVRGAVARIAEEAYDGFTTEQRETARRILLRLASVEGDDAVRRRAPLSELDLDTNEDARRVVSVLTESRLVTVSEEALEVSHEALLREWPRLREWLEEDAEGRRLHGHVIRAAKEWEDAGRDPAELYRGARLAGALDWAADHDAELNELERSFLAESQTAGEAESRRIRRTNRRLRLLLAGAVVFLVAAVAGGSIAVLQSIEARRESDRAARAARIAQARELASTVLNNYKGDPTGSILAAVEAVEVTRRVDGFVLDEARQALIIALGIPGGASDDQVFEPGVAPGTLAPTIGSDRLLEEARRRIPRPMTDEECRFYLHEEEECPSRVREVAEVVQVPSVLGEAEEVARARLERAGFGMYVTGTFATNDPHREGVVVYQDAGIGDAQGRVWARPGVTIGVKLYSYSGGP